MIASTATPSNRIRTGDFTCLRPKPPAKPVIGPPTLLLCWRPAVLHHAKRPAEPRKARHSLLHPRRCSPLATDVHAAINRPRAECLPAKRQWPWQAAHDRQASAIIHRSPTCPSALGATSMNRRHYAISLQQASEDSPTLAKLAALTRESSERLQAIELLIPAALRGTVQAGPIDGTSWCLLVKSNAAAAKIRQLLPALQAHLRNRGWEVHSIRLKIQS